MTSRARRVRSAMAGATALAGGIAATTAGQTISEGDFYFIAEDLIGTRKVYHAAYIDGATPLISATSIPVQTADVDLPAVIPFFPNANAGRVSLIDGGDLYEWQVFGSGGAEPAGIWGTGGVALTTIAGFQEPLVGFDNPLIALDIAPSGMDPQLRGDQIALHELGWVSFENPIISGSEVAGPMERPIPVAGPGGLVLIEVLDDGETSAPLPGTAGLVVRGMAAFPPGSVATQPQPDIPEARPALAVLAGPSRGVFPSIVGIWGTDGVALEGAEKQIWTPEVARTITMGGLLVEPVAMIAWPAKWKGLDDSFFVVDAGGGAAKAGAPPRIIGVEANGTQRAVSTGGLLGSPTDLAVLPSGDLIVTDQGGLGSLILIDPDTGAQTLLAQGSLAAGFLNPLAVGVAICSKPTFVVTSTADGADANPGDGIPEDSFGRRTLRAAVMEANLLPCGAIIDLSGVSVTLAIPGQNEDASATGDLDITGNIAIFGAGRDITRVSGNGLDRVFDVRPGASLTLQDLEVTLGNAVSSGGGIASSGNLVLNRVLVESNQTTGGSAGVWNGGGNLVAIDSEISSNTTPASVGGVFSGFFDTAPQVLMARCLVHANSAGINAGGIRAASGPMELVNVTASGNSAGRSAGGVMSDGNSTVTLDHCTIADNVADSGGLNIWTGGGLYKPNGGSSIVRLRSTIVANNQTGAVDPDNISGGYFSQGYNLLEDTSGATFTGDVATNIIDPAPGLAALADNGGPTRTHALLVGSPAIDAANPIGLIASDQRGEARPTDGDLDTIPGPDIGAYELVPTPCLGDVDGDGDTDVFDFADLAANFGAGPGATRQQGDITGDGFVDVFDFAELASDFGCVPTF